MITNLQISTFNYTRKLKFQLKSLDLLRYYSILIYCKKTCSIVIMVCQHSSFREVVFLNNLKLLNIFVMIISVFMVFVGCDLMMNYFMDSRYFSTLKSDDWPIYSLPLVFIGVGGATLMTSIACFICSVFQYKRPVIGYAIVMIFLVLGKFASLFVIFKAEFDDRDWIL